MLSFGEIVNRVTVVDLALDAYHPESKGDDFKAGLTDYITEVLHDAYREDDLQNLESVTNEAIRHFKNNTRPLEGESCFSTAIDKIADALLYAHHHVLIQERSEDFVSIAIHHVNVEYDQIDTE